MKYKNTRTGHVIDVPDVIKGAEWEAIEKPKAKPEIVEPEPPTCIEEPEPLEAPIDEPKKAPKRKGKRK